MPFLTNIEKTLKAKDRGDKFDDDRDFLILLEVMPVILFIVLLYC